MWIIWLKKNNNNMILIACPDQGSGNDTEALGLAKK